MLIAVDLSRLYFAVRDLKLRLDYEKLFNLLIGDTPKEETTIHAFTVANTENKKQRKFLARLSELGVEVHIHDLKTRPSFSEELSALCLEQVAARKGPALLVSNDRSLIRVFDMFKEQYGPLMTLCFFSEKLEGRWASTILRDKTKFIDLSDPENLKGILLQAQEVQPNDPNDQGGESLDAATTEVADSNENLEEDHQPQSEAVH